MVSPLFHTSPKHRFFPSPCSVSAYASSSHFFRTARGSFSHGFAEMIDCMNILTPLRLLDNGPNTEGIESWPSIEFTAPAYGIRPYDGRNPYNPLKAEGIRTDLVIFVSTICCLRRNTGSPSDIRTDAEWATFQSNQGTFTPGRAS